MIIRPGGLLDNSNTPNTNEIELNQKDFISGNIDIVTFSMNICNNNIYAISNIYTCKIVIYVM